MATTKKKPAPARKTAATASPRDRDPRVRAQAARKLATRPVRDAEAMAALLRLARDREPAVAQAAASGIVKKLSVSAPFRSHEGHPVAAYARLLKRSKSSWRYIGAEILTYLADPRSLRALTRHLSTETSVGVSYQIIRALVKIGDPKAIPALEAKGRKSRYLARAAARAIKALGGETEPRV